MKIKYIINENVVRGDSNYEIPYVSEEVMKEVRDFHKSFPQYEKTPLIKLEALAKKFCVESIYVKDESKRFGLNAFKVLGGSYAVGKYIKKKIGSEESLTYDYITSREVKNKLGDVCFVSTTDGNHGKGLAWTSRVLGQKSAIFMPKGSTSERLESIKKEGSYAEITTMNYDDCVRYSEQYAKENNGVLVQDSSWEGYIEIPTWIIQGYLTVIDETILELEEKGEKLTHVFLQAGVGSFAGSILGYLTAKYKEKRPKVIIAEPHNAACMYKSAKINDTKPHAVGGDLDSIMAGLCCGEPGIVTWDVIRDYSDAFISCDDKISADGMRILASPLEGDSQIVSGESGAVGVGALYEILNDEELVELKENLEFNNMSKVLIISTEGDTDKEMYEKIVWQGII